MADYLILGGGLAGCVLASRLKEYDPSLSITLIETGPNEHDHPLITEPMGTMQLHNSPFEYNLKTVPQKHYDGREVFQAGGKLLSGSSSVNYGAWTRGDRSDFDLWGKMVNDERWSYEGFLPYFRRTETHHDPQADPHQHGFDGPIHSTPALSRTYPLTERLKEAYLKIGVKPIHDHNGGDNKGMAPHVENWHKGKRQPAGKAYGLEGVKVMTNTTVKRIILEDGQSSSSRRAKGVELTSGQTLDASKEVIVSCGAFRSPQLLMLSGIGPTDELEKHSIPVLVESPEVGKNLCDHSALTQFYRIHDPEKGLCAPNSAFNHPSYLEGFPTDYIIAESAPSSTLKHALQLDSPDQSITDNHPSLSPPRSHYEILPMYAPTEVPLTNMNIPLDGSIISIGILNLLPTSRGRLALASTNPVADPLIDPNYYSTQFDRAVLRAAMRRNMAAFETPEGQAVVAEEIAPAGFPSLTSKSTDEELDARVRRAAASFYHAAGTASMGRVVDTECRVKGVDGLRVIDASVIPTPISAHYMVVVYALAEQMAEIIAGKGSA
ncbi:MAG: hypothetical protein Q9201_003972 [Fulgogasparrea decipioides]